MKIGLAESGEGKIRDDFAFVKRDRWQSLYQSNRVKTSKSAN